MIRFLPCLCLLAACSGPSVRDIRVAEDRREAGASTLAHALVSSGDPETRARAALALGRIQDPNDIALLVGAAADPDPMALRAVVFALGQMALGEDFDGNPRGADDAVAPHRSDPDPAMRRTAVEALGKLGGPRAAERLAEALRDPAAEVRGEAALGLFRLRFMPVWTKRAKEPPPLPPIALNALVDAAGDPDAGVRWRVAYALARYGEPAAVEALKKLAADEDAWARLFAVRALGRSKASAAADSIRLALRDPGPLVRTEAVGAAERLKLWDLLAADLLADPSFHVRAALARALASKEAGRDELLEKLSGDPSLTVRCDALVSRVRRGDAAAGLRAMEDPHWRMRKAAASAGGIEVAERAVRDPDRRVRAAAIESFGGLSDGKSAAMIRAALEDPDLGIRVAAVGALAERKDLPRFELLRACAARSGKREEVELREEIAEAAAKLPEATPFLRELLKDAAPSVRSKARRELVRRGEKVPPREAPAIEPNPLLDRSFRRPPVVVLETERGTIEIECLSAEAPVHTASFVELVRRGIYDGLLFHRVVSNFVIQGGDPRGDGTGDAGYNLRDEINRVPFERGTVGMPKAGKDTGGCQIFITHTPAPHLDGSYTVFGRVAAGMDVVDRIEEGDLILRARVRE
ncbi:MAG: HEAT repeat domain-containing protein [Planctomycetes bacterium]|nr:HEAT repeat domain-containing protein [Planctomycetota bacterium]